MEEAFDPGYDPALEIASHAKKVDAHGHDDESLYLRRQEQEQVDKIISGQEAGHYFMLLGSKVCYSVALPHYHLVPTHSL